MTPIPSAGTQQTSAVPAEPEGPKPTPAVHKVIDEAVRLSLGQRYEEALRKVEEAARVAVTMGDSVGEAVAHEYRSEWHNTLGHRPERMAAAEEAAKAWERAGDGLGLARSLVTLGVYLLEDGDPRGKEHLEQAFSLCRQETTRPLAAARTLGLAGEGLVSSGRDEEARKFFSAALVEFQRLAPDSLGMAHTLFYMGRLERDWSFDNRRQEEYFRQAYEIQKRLAPRSPALSDTLFFLGVLAGDRIDHPKARATFLQALEVLEASDARPRGRARRRAALLHHISLTSLQLGDFAVAEEYGRRAVELQSEIDPGSLPHARFVSGLGMIAAAQGDWSRAEEHHRAALEMAEQLIYSQREFRARVDGDIAGFLFFLGGVRQARGDLAGAREHYERAVALYEKQKTRVADWLSMGALEQLGQIARELGDGQAAEQFYRRTLSIKAEIVGDEHPHVAASLAGLALVLADRGQYGQALEAATRAERISREHASLLAQSLTEREALFYASRRVSGLRIALSLTAQDSFEKLGVRGAALDSVIRSRATVLDEMASRHREVVQTQDPEAERLNRTLATARERLARALVRGPGEQPERYRAVLDRLGQEKENAERALAERSAVFRAEQARNQVGLEEVVAALPTDSALVAFARFERLALGSTTPGRSGRSREPVPYYLAFVLRGRQREPVVAPLGPGEAIDALVSQLRQQIVQEAQAPGRAARRNESAYRAAAEALRRKVWDPIAPHLGQAKRVFLVPDGALHLVNFAALPVGPVRYLIETGPIIHYLSAERDLVPVGTERQNVGLLALGAPAFDERKLFAALAPEEKKTETTEPVQRAALRAFRGSRSACGTFQSMRFEALPASAKETERIVALWKKSAVGAKPAVARLRGVARETPDDVLYLRGADATEAAIKLQAPGKRVLHLATHGFFLGGRCASALESSTPLTSEVKPASVTGESPLLLSGLVLAGANHRQASSSEEEDGILTAEEIAALNLTGVEWAVLSACDTGVGEVKAGEGVFGLRRAFRVAGVRTVIMSLWPVEDEATREWMTALYEQRFLKLDTAQAVHEASLKLLRQRRAKRQSSHPFYWAGFVAAGDWR